MKRKKGFKGRDSERKSSQRMTPGSILSLFILIGVLIAATVLSYIVVTNRIIESSIDNLQELAAHDRQAILSSLTQRWDTLDGIGTNLRQRDIETTDDLLRQLNLDRNMLDCLRVLLVTDAGEALGSDQNISEDAQLLEICQASGARFVCHLDCEDSPVEGRSEVLLLGVALEPFAVEGRTFTHLLCMIDLDSIQDELLIVNYDGRGYASVIDEEGNYIVHGSRSHSTQDPENYFDMIQAGELGKGFTVGQIRNRLRSQHSFSMRYTTASSDSRIISFTPMEETNWYFIMAVSRSVFENQSKSLIGIVLILLMVVIAMVIVGVVFILRRRSMMLQQEIKHREALSAALAGSEQANRAKTTFLSNMSHDIRTPMNAIIGFTALATNNAEDPQRVRDYLQKISQSSTHLLSLINDVLDMSRIESGKMQLEPRPENLPEILHYLRNIIQADIQAKHLSLAIDTVNVTHEQIICDRLRLNQVLLNLISNAIKYTPSGGSISLRITEKKPPQPGYACYEFSVLDTGIGMKSEFLKTIFEPFTRERNSTVSGIQGTGLGMAITKSIVDLMNGSIKVTSEEGKGSQFVVDLTFKLAQTAPQKADVIESLQGLRALVVDDDVDSCYSVSQMLRQMGIRPESASSGREAVELARKASDFGDAYDVFIVDWQLPDIGGLETARLIRDVAGSSAHIIAFSTSEWSDISEQAATVGVYEFISKPLFASELREALLRACSNIREAEEPQVVEDNSARFAGRRILLVEDNELNREIAMEILGEVGFEIDSAENGQIAYEKVRDSEPGHYGLVLMDVQMPVMNGYDATRAIRGLENPKLAQIPIIAMTANAFEEDKRAAFEAGMDGHLGKPIDVPLLMRVLGQIFEPSREK